MRRFEEEGTRGFLQKIWGKAALALPVYPPSMLGG